MKTITPFLLRFILCAIALTIMFRYFLSLGIETHSTWIINISAVLYGIVMFIAGWHFGKQDANYLPIYDVGFRFHLATYLVHNLISELWFIGGFNAKYERIETTHYTAIIWGVFLLLHFILYMRAKKSSIDGLDKADLFE